MKGTQVNNPTDPPIDERASIVRGYRPIAELIPPHWQVGDLLANGIRQHYYRTGGVRPPVVLLHGIMDGALAWLPTARALEPDFDVIMLDARGHGHSARVAGDFTPGTLAADAAGALRALGLDGVRLLGFSQGAATAAFVADRHPGLVGRLILAGMAEGGAAAGDMMSSPHYQAWLSAYTSWLEALKGQSHAERMVAGLSQLAPGAPIPPEEEYVAWVENSTNLDLELVRMSAQLWGQLGATVEAMQAAIGRLACPTLLIKSAMTQYSSGPLTLREEPSGQPNVRILHFENTGHVIYRDRFDAFAAQVRAFFAHA
jgi:pimeloyl-ACP methyl ester carboxylesterase